MDNYVAGVNAIKAEQWPDAITALASAMAMDPVPRSYKEGVYSGDYFPQYYLFVAYLRTNNIEQARRFYALRGPLPPRLSIEAKPYVAELNGLAEPRTVIPGATVRAVKVEPLDRTRMTGSVTIVVNGVT